MPIYQTDFTPNFRWRNPHLQTIWPAKTRRVFIPKRTDHWVTLSDGDQILLESMHHESEQESEIGVLLIHGLSGSADSPYILGLQKKLSAAGYASVAMNMRGAKEPNNRARTYHSGSSDDVSEIVRYLSDLYPNRQWIAIGFSLGGNVLLKYLGESANNHLKTAVAVSVPLRLDVCASHLDTGISRIYRGHLLKELRRYQSERYRFLKKSHPEQAEVLSSVPYNKKFTSFWDYDHQVVAPLNGFESAEDYYQKCSSRYYLNTITTPTLIIQATDDPFMNKEVLPREGELSHAVTLELNSYGGHVGFYTGSEYYVEERILEWIGCII